MVVANENQLIPLLICVIREIRGLKKSSCAGFSFNHELPEWLMMDGGFE